MGFMRALLTALTLITATVAPAVADQFFFSTGNPDGLIGMASRPASAGKIEIEAADDFVTTTPTTSITSATFTGLIPPGVPLSAITGLNVEIYRVFPSDSNAARTPNVPTRANSPSDVAFDTRSSSAGELTFTPSIVNASFTAGNSVLNGINASPNQTTHGEGAVTGLEVQFNVLFTTPFSLPADHYFFVPQVQLSTGDFFWLSAPRPIAPPGTSFPAGATDLQTWIRNEGLEPDWLRVGTDIIGGNPAPTFNAAFTLTGETSDALVPEPSTVTLLAVGGLALFRAMRRRRVR
jgi:hypothetical protein